MTTFQSECPDQKILKQFILGQLSIPEIENCQQHLSECSPCVETIENLKVGDTFTDLANQAFQCDVPAGSALDNRLIGQMIDKAQAWRIESNGLDDEIKLSLDKAAEVQRLLREPVQVADVGSIAHFRLTRLIGTGSTGIVYLAVDTKLDRNVVLKILRPSLGEPARKRFVAEAKAAAAIDHPNVVTIYEVGNDGPLSYIAMQWISGQTLEQKLDEQESLSVEQTRKLVEEIAQGLAAAHKQGLIHRDIKPANIWIPDCEEPAKILDFGLVRVNDEDPQLTCTGMIAGTPCFMSPEQSRGDKLDVRSDLFSLGCLMYQALTGQLPFRSDNALATLRSIQQDQPTAPAELDSFIDHDISDLVMCLLAKSPSRRPPSAHSLVKALQSDSRRNWEFDVVSPIAETKPRKLKTTTPIWKIAVTLLIGIALAAFGFAYQEQIVRIASGQGVIEIQTEVDDVKIEVVGNGEVVRVVDLTTEQSIEIKAGNYEIRPVGDGNSVSIDKNKLTLSRGATEIVRIEKRYPTVDTDPNQQTVGQSTVDQNVASPNSVGNSLEQAIFNQGFQLEMAKQRLGPGHPTVQAARLRQDMLLNYAKDKDAKRYRIGDGDVLGIFIDGVLGSMGEDPPIHRPEKGSGERPSIGFPIQVEGDGTINLPLVGSLPVAGKRIAELRKDLVDKFTGGENPILRPESRIMVSVIKTGSGSTIEDLWMPTSEFESKHQVFYNGRTFEDWLQIAKTERKFDLLIPAIEGLVNLAQDYPPEPTKSIIVSTIRRYSSVGEVGFQSYIQVYLDSLTPDEKIAFLIEELNHGNQYSIYHLLVSDTVFNRERKFKSQFLKTVLNATGEPAAIAKKVASALQENLVRLEVESVAAPFLIDCFYKRWTDLELDRSESVRVLFSEFLKTNDAIFDPSYTNRIFELAPETPGLIEHIENQLKEFNQLLRKVHDQKSRSASGFVDQFAKLKSVLGNYLDSMNFATDLKFERLERGIDEGFLPVLKMENNRIVAEMTK